MELLCFQTFSQLIKKHWGGLLFNSELSERHDANHAEVVTLNQDYNGIISEISQFYEEKGVKARINFYEPDSLHPFKNALVENDFKNLDTNTSTSFMKLEEMLNIDDMLAENDDFKVSFCPNLPINSLIGQDIAKVIHSDWTYQNLVSNENYYYFILYDKKEPVSVLSYFLHDEFKLARLDDVVTIPEKRGKGYMSFLLRFASNWIQNTDLVPYLFVNDDIARKLYLKVGFKEQFICKNVYWIKNSN
jgi:GNAT superfamily N-acetyltransferase